MHGTNVMHTTFLLENMMGRDHLEDLEVDGKLFLIGV
jgi:hypothetical protein